MRFNEKSLAAIKPEQKDVYRWDESFKGNRNGRFGLRIYPSGTKRYVYDYISDTRVRRRIVIGDFEHTDLARAREIAKSYAHEVYHGKDPAKELFEKRNSITFGELKDLFICRHCNLKLKPKTTKNYEQILKRDLLPPWKDRRIADITKKDIQAILNAIVNRDAATQAERTREVISSIFEFAVSQGEIDQNPCAGIGEVVPTKARTRKLDIQEIVKFWTACGNLKSKSMGIYLKLLLVTGQRCSEIASARCSDLESTADGEIWHFPETKSGRPQTIPVSRVVRGLLDEIKKINQELKRRSRRLDKSRFDEFIFPSKYSTGKGHITDVKDAFQKVFDEMQTKHFTPHDLRRTASHTMRQLRVRQETLTKVLNHASKGVTGIHYDHYDEMPEMRVALNDLADGVLAMLSGNFDEFVKLCPRK